MKEKLNYTSFDKTTLDVDFVPTAEWLEETFDISAEATTITRSIKLPYSYDCFQPDELFDTNNCTGTSIYELASKINLSFAENMAARLDNIFSPSAQSIAEASVARDFRAGNYITQYSVRSIYGDSDGDVEINYALHLEGPEAEHITVRRLLSNLKRFLTTRKKNVGEKAKKQQTKSALEKIREEEERAVYERLKLKFEGK